MAERSFKNYNTLNLFYVGYGEMSNTTTRFRRYYAEYNGVDDARVKAIDSRIYGSGAPVGTG